MLKRFLLLTAILSSFQVWADFDYTGKGTLKYPTGMTKAFDFGFAFKQGENGYFFQVGKQKMSTADVPAKYSIWLTLHNDESVFVQEFGKGYFQEFTWQLGEHKVELKKKIFKNNRVKGDYVLVINGQNYFFHKKTGQLDILFNSKGIRTIDTVGFVRDRSFSKN